MSVFDRIDEKSKGIAKRNKALEVQTDIKNHITFSFEADEEFLKNYKIFQASKKKKAEIQQKTASMSASVCGDTAGVLLLSAVKYFFCLIFQGKKTICTAKL